MMMLLIVITGIMAGVYFTFSVFVMKSLGELPALEGAKAMNKINDVIINTLFLPLFFLSTLWYAGLIVWSLTDWQSGYSEFVISASVIYIAGMFFVTAFGNVPLNNQLKRVENHETKLAQFWVLYQRKWTWLNHVRTISCTLACLFLVWSMA